MKTKLKIGVDEAGRGPWFGPVVACAISFNPNLPLDKDFLLTLKDSKKLSEKQRERIYEKLISYASMGKIFFGVGVVDNQYIDDFNIRQSTKEAMRRALIEILGKIGFSTKADKKLYSQKENTLFNIESVVIDGKDNFIFDELERKPIYVIEGDSKILEISAASIIAKVFRDKIIKTYAELYPNLGLENHKGYGTKEHIQNLKDSKDVTGFHRKSYKPVQKILSSKPRLLLHICCGPDATVPIVDLKESYDIICYWYDPNIQPRKEYDKRLRAFKKVCKIESIPYIIGEYDVKNFFKKIKGLEKTPEKGEKCRECYDMRLQKTAELAEKLGITYWTSTLNTSPHKDLEKMFAIGDKYSFGKNLEFLKIAFRKNNGFLRSVEYTKKHKIYRQDYCGCIYSDTFPGNPKREKILGGKKGYSGG